MVKLLRISSFLNVVTGVRWWQHRVLEAEGGYNVVMVSAPRSAALQSMTQQHFAQIVLSCRVQNAFKTGFARLRLFASGALPASSGEGRKETIDKKIIHSYLTILIC